MEVIEYKKLALEHIKEIAGIYVNAFNSEQWNDKWTTESASKRISQMINCEGFDGLIAYEDEKIVGMILGNHEYYYDVMIFQIKELCIDINVKGNGIGSKLLEEFIERLKAKGIGRIFLFTLRSNETEGFYKRHKFQNYNDMVMMGREI